MRYSNVHKAIFLERRNRFVARVELNGREETVHVKNTGRCRELLIPGAVVYLEKSDRPERKTQYDLIAVEKNTAQGVLLVNMDAQAPNKVFQEWAEAGYFRPDLTRLKPECKWGNSRFDFYFEAGERRGFVEVKGVTLETEGNTRFPDAPTERGVKHLEELIACREAGHEAYVCFIIQMAGMKQFSPNDAMHPAFGEALRRAAAAGVTILAYGCAVTSDSLTMTEPVPVVLVRDDP